MIDKKIIRKIFKIFNGVFIALIISFITLFLIGLSSIRREKPKTVKVPKQQDVIYPVIYEDVGEPPWLYPEKMNIKIHPKPQTYSSAWEDAFEGLGNVFKTGIKLFGKKKKDDKK